ncbi:hypothetical protein SAMN06297280_0507 [Arsukibacterium tuosuense]|uniref:Beta-ketoacyl synthase N-terminal domain-containing protein n=1 Tax=Arsukibacterium tuosuense TaxID=1323745 RepID=A0A285I7L5_9GAMM|nr:hypothetical protein [Arsukibacterium tuosuense]SNY42941.1 hypothetical protein SAMN06297280_0507 [Arsukibacterium tuosuense]
MASCLTVTDYAAVLGKTADTEWALQLDVMPVEPVLASQAGQLRQVNRLANPDLEDPDLSFAGRLVAMLKKLRSQLSLLPDAAPVLLVLPEQVAGEQALAGVVQTLRQAFPELLGHSACQLFPYGRSAALMAINAARQLLTAGESVVWIIGLDSPVSAMSVKEPTIAELAECQISDNVVWSEGAVALALQHSKTGLCCHYLAADATVSSATQELAIAQLFDAVAANTDSALTRIYLPDNGSSELTACWQSSYQRLAPRIEQTTQLSLPAYSTGELGAAGGLYRFLHLYLAYSNANQQGVTLQCEISERLYRAVAVFSWQQAGSISEF